MDELEKKLKRLSAVGLFPTDETLKSQQLAKARMAFESASQVSDKTESLFSWKSFFGAGLVTGAALAACFACIFISLPLELRNAAGTAAVATPEVSPVSKIRALESVGLNWYMLKDENLTAEMGQANTRLIHLRVTQGDKQFFVGAVVNKPLKLTFIESQPNITLREHDGVLSMRCSCWDSEKILSKNENLEILGWKLSF